MHNFSFFKKNQSGKTKRNNFMHPCDSKLKLWFLKEYCSKIVYLIKEPDFLFSSVGKFYNDFKQIEDEEIEKILS